MATIAVCGFGSFGRELAADVTAKPHHDLVSVVDLDPELVGTDVGTVLGRDELGVTVTDDLEAALQRTAPEVTVVGTASRIPDVEDPITTAVRANSNVISTAEELVFPHGKHPDVERRLDEAATDEGVTIVGGGINPGFVLDRLVVALSGPCRSIGHVHARREADVRRYEWSVEKLRDYYGFGLPVEEYLEKRADGGAPGHLGMAESAHMVADALGVDVDDVTEYHHPVLTESGIETSTLDIDPNTVRAARDEVHVTVDGTELIHLETTLGFFPDGGCENRIVIDGTPPIDCSFDPEIESKNGTVGCIYNAISPVVDGPAGLRTMNDLEVPSYTFSDG